jgi:hypothetical protein
LRIVHRVAPSVTPILAVFPKRKILNATLRTTYSVRVLKQVQRRGVRIFAFANNHYAGFAPETVRLFNEIWVEGNLDSVGTYRA